MVKHLEDIKHRKDLLNVIICVTETWLGHGHSTDNFTISGFRLFRHDRQDSYTFHICPQIDAKSCNKCNSKGDLAVYIRDRITVLDLPAGVFPITPGLEIMTTAVESDIVGKLIVVLVYRPQYVDLNEMYWTLEHHIQPIADAGYPVIILWDFNEDLLKTSTDGHTALTSHGPHLHKSSSL